MKNGLASLSLRSNSSNVSKPSFSLSQLKGSQPVVAKMENLTMTDTVMKDSDTHRSAIARAKPSDHGLFLTSVDFTISSPVTLFSLTTFLDSGSAFSGPSPNMQAQQPRQKPSSMR
jgi:hypothetical protein